jgi:hypothetical protein
VIASDARYQRHLFATYRWTLRSIEHGRGGSCAYYIPILGWSAPYPETTGYLIPTLISSGAGAGDDRALERATSLGEWLLGIQEPDGYWLAGTHPPKRPEPSVFNTAQIIKGMCALYKATGEHRWFKAAERACRWLSAGVGGDGIFSTGNYRSDFNPSYYTQVAWPMLEVWRLTDNTTMRNAAKRVLGAVAARQQPDGAFTNWGFEAGAPAFTHTIAYLLRGLLESARLLNDVEVARLTMLPLETLRRKAEIANGDLPGSYDTEWRGDKRFVCLTGNAQTAICFLLADALEPDLRWVNAAAKLVDAVCRSQALRHVDPGILGGVAGSRPIWGSYMRFRYPNWAAKYHLDALTRLRSRLAAELAEL